MEYFIVTSGILDKKIGYYYVSQDPKKINEQDKKVCYLFKKYGVQGMGTHIIPIETKDKTEIGLKNYKPYFRNTYFYTDINNFIKRYFIEINEFEHFKLIRDKEGI